MKKSKFLILANFLVVLLVGMSACGNISENTTSNNQSDNSLSESTDDSSNDNIVKNNNNDNENLDKTSDDSKGSQVEVEQEQDNTTNTKASNDVTNKTKENENIQEDKTTKIEGRKNEFIKELDNIQKELDVMPDKKDSDTGVTNAMKNYYGISYETYDKALNEIYGLLKKELSPETMKDLKTKQIEWIDEKENMAKKESLKYEGGTFENVAYYISLYESTKERCYDLVNTYMTE